MTATTPESATRPAGGYTMDLMTPGAHAKPARRDGLLWAVAAIAGFALYDIWGSWAEVGDKSGFAHGTGWTLTVIVEVYAVCALYAWLSPVGPRSRRFAMWSAMIMFVLSLVGQASSHLTASTQIPPAGVVVFVSVLPVITVAMIAILVHLRHADRAEAVEAGERSTVQAEIDALRAERDEAVTGLAAVRAELAEAVAAAETLTRKLEAATARKRRPATARKSSPATARKSEPVTGSVTGSVTAPEEADELGKEALVLKYLAEGHSASEAGKLAGLSDSRGRQIARKLAAAAPRGQDPQE